MDDQRRRRNRRRGEHAECIHCSLSFHPVKHFTTGEGGAVLFADEVRAANARSFRSHGITRDALSLERNDGPWWYEQHELGFNYRLPDILAALGMSQLPTLPARGCAAAREIADAYRRRLHSHPSISLPPVPTDRFHAYPTCFPCSAMIDGWPSKSWLMQAYVRRFTISPSTRSLIS